MSGKCQGKSKFSPGRGKSGNFGHLTHVRELSGNLGCHVREFCHDIIFRLRLQSYDKGSTWVVLMSA